MALSDKSIKYINLKVAQTEGVLLNYAGIMETEAKINATWTDRSSHARQSLHSGVEREDKNMTLYLGHGAKYGAFLEEGTPPHIIRPKNKKALYWNGASHPVKKVNHPGTKPYPILNDTIDKNINKLTKNILRVWEGL